MSYARFGVEDSSVYVILATSGHLECTGCTLSPWRAYHSTSAMLAHLQAHMDRGDTVPYRTIEDLRADADENDRWLAAIGRAS